jgi:hypothetical protein
MEASAEDQAASSLGALIACFSICSRAVSVEVLLNIMVHWFECISTRYFWSFDAFDVSTLAALLLTMLLLAFACFREALGKHKAFKALDVL